MNMMLNCINILLVGCFRITNDIKGALCNHINAGSGVQVELLAVAKLLIVAANEE